MREGFPSHFGIQADAIDWAPERAEFPKLPGTLKGPSPWDPTPRGGGHSGSGSFSLNPQCLFLDTGILLVPLQVITFSFSKPKILRPLGNKCRFLAL